MKPWVSLMDWPGGRRCCICFEGFTKDRLYTDWDGDTWDICWGCVPMARLGGFTFLTWPA